MGVGLFRRREVEVGEGLGDGRSVHRMPSGWTEEEGESVRYNLQRPGT